MDTNITGSGPMKCNRERSEGSSWTLAPVEEEEEEEHYSKESHK
jgi:hypothetical protein